LYCNELDKDGLEWIRRVNTTGFDRDLTSGGSVDSTDPSGQKIVRIIVRHKKELSVSIWIGATQAIGRIMSGGVLDGVFQYV
jgi:hypothetical protein